MRAVPWGHVILSFLCGAAVLGFTVLWTLSMNDKNPIQPITIGFCGALGVSGVVYTILRIDSP